MFREMEIQKNNIGTAIQYFRETYHISQSKLCKGICSVSTLSRIEAGERDVDALILETLLERLGKVPHQYELILTDFDYKAYMYREEIKKRIIIKDIDGIHNLLQKYDELTMGKGTPHKQFIKLSKALLNELEGGEPETTINLLMEAICCTVPDFNTNDLSDYYLSKTEFSIILDILERLIALGKIDWAKILLNQILDYLYWHSQMEQNSILYPKVAVIAGKFFMEENNIEKALDICNTGLEMHKASRKIDYLGELLYIKAQLIEMKYNTYPNWETSKKKECLKLYLEAYHIFDICGEKAEADKIQKHLQEAFQWEDIG